MNTNLQDIAALAGRILLALIFVTSGFGKITGYAATLATMKGKGLPMTEVLLVLTILIELGGGLAIAIGWKARWAALLIAALLVPVTLVFHNPMGLADAQAHAQTIQMMKNISIMGGMLLLAAFGPGRFSLDGRKSV